MRAIGTKLASELIQAINSGAVDEVRGLLDAGADANSISDECPAVQKMVVDVQRKEARLGPPTRKTALQIACHLGNVDVVRELIAAGAHVNMPDELGWTSLMFACRAGAVDVAKLLVENGASTDDEYQAGSPYASALGMLGLNKGELVEFLLGYPQPSQVLQRVLHNAFYYHSERDAECSPEHAQRNANELVLRIVNRALDAGAGINVCCDGDRPIERAIRIGSMPIMQLLLERGADVNRYAGSSPMSHACTNLWGEPYIRALTAHGAVVHEKDLDMAIKTEHDEVILAALENCTLNGVDHRQMRMENAGHVSVLEAVIRAGDCPKSARHLFEVMGEDLFQKSRSGVALLRLCKPQTKQVILSLRAGEVIADAVGDQNVDSQKPSLSKNEVGML